MRFNFDSEKSWHVRRKHGISLEEAQAVFDQAYIVDQKSDNPEQVPGHRMVWRPPLFRYLRDPARLSR